MIQSPSTTFQPVLERIATETHRRPAVRGPPTASRRSPPAPRAASAWPSPRSTARRTGCGQWRAGHCSSPTGEAADTFRWAPVVALTVAVRGMKTPSLSRAVKGKVRSVGRLAGHFGGRPRSHAIHQGNRAPHAAFSGALRPPRRTANEVRTELEVTGLESAPDPRSGPAGRGQAGPRCGRLS